jgi:uncharacterized protein YndB with AHSA1/START domain
MTTGSITRPHFAKFTIARTYRHSPERVFHAFEDEQAHYRWFVSGEGWEIDFYRHDFRVGGHAQGKFRMEGMQGWLGNDTWHLEIVKALRIVSAYSMTMDGKPFSHSLATTELAPDSEGGCRLTYTEQGIYQGGDADVANRKAGCDELYDKLALELDTYA